LRESARNECGVGMVSGGLARHRAGLFMFLFTRVGWPKLLQGPLNDRHVTVSLFAAHCSLLSCATTNESPFYNLKSL